MRNDTVKKLNEDLEMIAEQIRDVRSGLVKAAVSEVDETFKGRLFAYAGTLAVAWAAVKAVQNEPKP